MEKILEKLYSGVVLKKPEESKDYEFNSKLATKQIKNIIQKRIDDNKNEMIVKGVCNSILEIYNNIQTKNTQKELKDRILAEI